MGEVYRAYDSTLGREVALKILPDPWLADTDRRLRFEREARLLASLNHPNIAAIYGVHESAEPGTDDTVKALVLELVEGETLADRLTAQGKGRGLPLGEVTDIASQIIDALEAAHARGVVHRDLKPANIKVTPEGRVKVLDFGLARAVAGDDPGGGLVSSPTVTAHATRAGVLLGTAPYMSPEQARGRTADRRADIWAFGCVLYEMLTGARAFGGNEVADVLAGVLTAEPDWRAVPAGTPQAIRLCLRRCLERDLRQRFQDIGDVRLALSGAFDRPVDESARAIATPRWAWVGWVLALVAVAGAVVLLVTRPGTVVDAPEMRLEIATPPTLDPLSIDISPDGRSVVFLGDDGNQPRLWVRRLESSEAQSLPGTESAAMPFWSPDGRSIGFFASGELRRIDLAGHFVRTLAPAPHPRHATWNGDGTIVFGSVAMGPLHSVSAGGGSVTQVTDLLPGQTSHRWPQFLPDGRRFLLMALGAPEVRGFYLGSLDNRAVKKVSDRESAFSFMPPDRFLLGRNGGLLARTLSSDGSVEGEPELVAPKLLIGPALTGHSSLRVSAAGHIIYRASAAQTQFVWLDRAGRQVGAISPGDDTQPELGRLSPDGRTAAVQRLVNGNSDVWLIDLERGADRRLTLDPGYEGSPVFSPDGQRVAYMSDGAADVWNTAYEQAADGTGQRKVLFDYGVRNNHYPLDWSMDGRFLLYMHETADSQSDLWALPVMGEGRPIEVARTSFSEGDGRFSPDGRWVAYRSTETGIAQIFVRPFPGPGPNRQVSSAQGWLPRWGRDGSELFYAEQDRLVAVPVSRRGGVLEFGAPRTLFTFPLGWTGGFDPSPDGQRFLITRKVTEASPITVILNWKPPSK
jgi:serine/threonine protein kinase